MQAQINVKHNHKKCKPKQCLQSWDFNFAINSSRTLFHLKVCEYLGIRSDLESPCEYEYGKQTESIDQLEDEFKHISKSILPIVNAGGDAGSLISNLSRKQSSIAKTRGKTKGKTPHATQSQICHLQNESVFQCHHHFLKRV